MVNKITERKQSKIVQENPYRCIFNKSFILSRMFYIRLKCDRLCVRVTVRSNQ